MLADLWEGEIDPTGWWMSEKFDGVRAYWTGRSLISRTGKPFAAPDWFIAGLPPEPLDGELWVGYEKFTETVSIVRRKAGGLLWKRVRYKVFDAPNHPGSFEARLRWLESLPFSKSHPYASVVKQQRCRDRAHLDSTLAAVEQRGGEGLMLRKPSSAYVARRSPELLKVKSFVDAEARVVGHLPGTGKHKGRLGSLLVELDNGIRFAIGTGFSDAEREKPPVLGSIITFKYHGFHPSGKPRFASFLRVRESL